MFLQVEATWAISNALSNGTDDHIRYLVEQNCVEALCDQLLKYDVATLEAVLEGFEHVLSVGDVDRFIHAPPSVYSLCPFPLFFPFFSPF